LNGLMLVFMMIVLLDPVPVFDTVTTFMAILPCEAGAEAPAV
jgi:hypothetical protein